MSLGAYPYTYGHVCCDRKGISFTGCLCKSFIQYFCGIVRLEPESTPSAPLTGFYMIGNIGRQLVKFILLFNFYSISITQSLELRLLYLNHLVLQNVLVGLNQVRGNHLESCTVVSSNNLNDFL